LKEAIKELQQSPQRINQRNNQR